MNQLLVVVAFACLCSAYGKKLEEKYAWKEMDFSWPSNEMKQEFIKTGQYIEENNLPLGLDIWKNKIFVTVPRYVHNVVCFKTSFVKHFKFVEELMLKFLIIVEKLIGFKLNFLKQNLFDAKKTFLGKQA